MNRETPRSMSARKRSMQWVGGPMIPNAAAN